MNMSDEQIDRKLENQRLIEWGVKHGMVVRPTAVLGISMNTFKRKVFNATRHGDTDSEFYSPHVAKVEGIEKKSRYYIPPVIDSLKEAAQ